MASESSEEAESLEKIRKIDYNQQYSQLCSMMSKSKVKSPKQLEYSNFQTKSANWAPEFVFKQSQSTMSKVRDKKQAYLSTSQNTLKFPTKPLANTPLRNFYKNNNIPQIERLNIISKNWMKKQSHKAIYDNGMNSQLQMHQSRNSSEITKFCNSLIKPQQSQFLKKEIKVAEFMNQREATEDSINLPPMKSAQKSQLIRVSGQDQIKNIVKLSSPDHQLYKKSAYQQLNFPKDIPKKFKAASSKLENQIKRESMYDSGVSSLGFMSFNHIQRRYHDMAQTNKIHEFMKSKIT